MTESESLLTFPCEFVLKVFGHKNDEFEKTVISILNTHCSDLKENAFSYRDSTDGKYLSISVKINATSKEQLDAIYRELSANPHILMVL